MKEVLKLALPVVAAVLIAVGSFFSGAVTNIGDAIDIAFNKEKAIEACKVLINGE